MNHKISLDYIIFWSSILAILFVSHEANGILTESNDLSCTHIQCPTECPDDSYLKSSIDEDEEDFEDYEDELLGHDPYIEELGHFEELPIDVENHDPHSPQNSLKERQKREVLFQEEIEKCCDDQKCVCLKCEDVPKCGEGQVAIEVHEGQGVPGNCCSLYRCVKKQECQMGVKQTWWASKCKKCFCFGENELCTQICPEEEVLHHCYSEYWQKPKMNGDFWKEGRCTSCTCEQGERRCFTPVCPKLECNNTKILEDECCPKCMDKEIVDKDIQEVRMCYSEFLQKPMMNGASWKEGANTSCTCEEGERICFSPKCPKFECKETEILEGELCPVCIEEVEEEKVEIVHNIENEIEDNEVEFSTESTTLDIPVIQIEEGTKNSSSYPIIDDSLINEAQTTSPIAELEESSSVSISFKDLEEISSTMEPEAIDLLRGNVSTTTEMNSTTSSAMDITSTTETSTEQSKLIPKEELETSSESTTNFVNSTTEQTFIQEGFDLSSTTTEEPKSVVVLEASSSSTSETTLLQTTPPTNVNESSTENSTESTTPEILLANSTLESSTESSTLSTEESNTIAAAILSSTASTTEDSQSSTLAESSSESTPSTSTIFSTSVAFESSSTTESVISTSTTTTDTPLTLSTESSTENSSSPTSSFSFSTTSTTSSPFSSTNDATSSSTESSTPEESSPSSSSTSGPEPLKPLFQPYGGDFSTEERSLESQNRMRILFDEIDYVVMIALFFGSLLCITLGLIIRHTKNRKKMYSSIPNSETSLSQNSTNTVLTV